MTFPFTVDKSKKPTHVQFKYAVQIFQKFKQIFESVLFVQAAPVVGRRGRAGNEEGVFTLSIVSCNIVLIFRNVGDATAVGGRIEKIIVKSDTIEGFVFLLKRKVKTICTFGCEPFNSLVWQLRKSTRISIVLRWVDWSRKVDAPMSNSDDSDARGRRNVLRGRTMFRTSS